MKEFILRLMFFMIIWTGGCLLAENVFWTGTNCSLIMFWGWVVIVFSNAINPFGRNVTAKSEDEDVENF